jgi:threonylcarbamoyladenosine tRNA methylthiotransferase CDKAL1
MIIFLKYASCDTHMAKIFIKTQGCSHNYADSAHMAGLLQQKHELVDNEDEADVILFNTCTVKTPTERTFLNNLNKCRQKKVVIAGCIPQADPHRFPQYSLIGTRQLDHVVEVVDRTLQGERVQLLHQTTTPQLSSPAIRENPLIDIIPISLGCLGQCSFCKTKVARGRLVSYPMDVIIDRVRRVTAQGVKEIRLTSEDTGCYGFDIGTNIANLLRELVKIEKDFTIRVGMMNPDHAMTISDDLIAVLRHEKVYTFLHLPVQSGNDDILRAMNRQYTVNQFRDFVNRLRAEIPDITLATDIIVGFPGETEQQFLDSVRLVNELQFDVVNISRFWARPGTAAARMPNQLSGEEIKRRSRILTSEFEKVSLERNRRWIGWRGSILITERGKNDQQWRGRNHAYKQVIINGDSALGENVTVEVVAAERYGLIAELR